MVPSAGLDTFGLIGDRWRLGELLGSGGGGRVWKVTDRYTGEEAALKLLRVASEAQRARVGREIKALRVLQLPGVVRLCDVGDHLGEPYVVMELLSGERFPGAGVGRDWARLAPRVHELVSILAQVHLRGFIHRDLKPDNIFVDAAGRVTVLDFGLARGSELGPTVTRPGSPVGTPRYLAPEQLRGEAVDARADLYALGVMLFECLAGHPPYPDAGFNERFMTMVVPPPPRLCDVAPEVPPEVGALVDALLVVPVRGRLESAQALQRRLVGLADAHGAPAPTILPFVGRQAELLELVVAAHEGRSLAVRARAGMGRTRLLREVAHRLGADGRQVGFTVAGRRPLESLQPLVGQPSTRDALAELGERLRERVRTGLVVLVDDPARLDTWSASLLAQVADAGSILGLADGRGAVELGPLDEPALAELFTGPSRVLHLPEDAARVLHARTAGVPSRMAAQLGAWVAAGLAAWEGDRLRVERPALDRLLGGLEVLGGGSWSVGTAVALDDLLADRLAWLVLAGEPLGAELLAAAAELPEWEVEAELAELVRVGAVRLRADGRAEPLTAPPSLHALDEAERDRRHRALARVLPPGSPARLQQWLLVGDAHEAVAEALVQSAALRGAGRASQAALLVSGTWAQVQAFAGADDAATLLTELVRATVEGTTASQRADAEAALAAAPAAELVPLQALLRASRLAAEGRHGEALALAEDLPPFADVDLEGARLAVVVRSLNERRDSRAEVVVTELAAHVEPSIRARAGGWLGLTRYEQERFEEAALLQEAAVAAETVPVRVARGLINASVAWLEVEPSRVIPLVHRLRELASAYRMAYAEMWSFHLHRAARYRCGDNLEPDGELLSISAAIGEPRRHSHLLLIEAAAAWRRGERDVAGNWAVEAAEVMDRAGSPGAGALPWALAELLGRAVPADLADRIAQNDRPRFRAQAAALHAWADAGGAPASLSSAPQLGRLDVLSLTEAEAT